MSQASKNKDSKKNDGHSRPFRRAVLRGLALLMPPLLTIIVFLWMFNLINTYVLMPIESAAEYVLVLSINDVHKQMPADATPTREKDGRVVYFHRGSLKYVPVNEKIPQKGKWIPSHIKEYVDTHQTEDLPTSASEYNQQYVRIRWLGREKTIPIFLMGFVLVLYFVGKLMAAGVGTFFWGFFEKLIHRLPIIRTVYSAAKQVTDFVFKEQEVEFTRVVAIQYPRKGIWSMGFVTGESFLDIRSAANEPVLSVLMPTSPMPATGFTITIAKSETIDLNITVDQAIQFCVSCGVVVPAHQQCSNDEIGAKVVAAVTGGNGQQSSPTKPAALPSPTVEENEDDV